MLRYVLLLLLCYQPSHASPRTLIPKVWQGELLEADEGALYLQSVLIDLEAQTRQGTYSFTLQGRRRQLSYTFQTSTADLKNPPDPIWKIKEDDYDLRQLVLIDDKGLRWEWKPPYRHSFKVQAKSLSYFGVWYLVQLKEKPQLKLLAKAGKNVMSRDRTQGAFQSIVEGATGRELVSLKEKKSKARGEMRQVLRSSRTIGMFYQLNLFRQNVHAPAMSQVFQANDPDIRSCYLELLDRQPEVQGKLDFTFVYSSQTKSIKSLKVKQTDIKENKFLECMKLKIMGLDFAIQSSLIGELSFSFQLGGS